LSLSRGCDITSRSGDFSILDQFVVGIPRLCGNPEKSLANRA
jgi:hypothetical protein